MLIASCPSCHEPVRIDPTLPDATELSCPWCREHCSVTDILHALPPMMSVVNVARRELQPAMAGQSDGISAFSSSNPYLTDGSHATSTESWADTQVDFVGDENASDFAASQVEFADTDTQDAASTEEFTFQEEPQEFEPEYAAEDADRVSDFSAQYETEVGEEEYSQSSLKPRRPRKQRSSLMSMVGVVAGGLLALPLAGGILYMIKPESLPSQVLDLFGKSNVKSGSRPAVAPQTPPDMNRGSDFNPNASMQDLAASKFGQMNAPKDAASAESDASSIELTTLDNATGKDDIAGSLSAAVDPASSIPQMKLPDVSVNTPAITPPKTPAMTLPETKPADAAASTEAAAAADSAAPVDAKVLEAVNQAVAKYGELPSATARDSAAVYIALANLAAKLPEGDALPEAVEPLVAKVATSKPMLEHLPMIEKQWWTAGAAKMNVPGFVAVGKADADGIAFITDGGVKIPIISESSLSASGRILLFGKIEGEGDSRVVKVTGTRPL
jgi:hypothetical protein